MQIHRLNRRDNLIGINEFHANKPECDAVIIIILYLVWIVFKIPFLPINHTFTDIKKEFLTKLLKQTIMTIITTKLSITSLNWILMK